MWQAVAAERRRQRRRGRQEARAARRNLDSRRREARRTPSRRWKSARSPPVTCRLPSAREAGRKDQQRHDHDPTADPEQRAEEAANEPDDNEPHGPILGLVSGLLAQLTESPQAAAIFLDVDGTLAPIAPRPEDAAVPEETRSEVARLAERYGLVACISGRTGEDAHRLVGVDGVRICREPRSRARARSQRVAGADPVVRAGHRLDCRRQGPHDLVPLPAVRRRGGRRSGSTSRRAEQARSAGLIPRFGRKVLEIRPPVRADKGTAVRHLLAETGLSRALYAGDDTTDLDAYRALDGLELAVRVAVSSDEAPVELVRSADIVVSSPAELLGLLRRL